MNPWNLLIIILGWIFLVVIVTVVAMVVFSVIEFFVRKNYKRKYSRGIIKTRRHLKMDIAEMSIRINLEARQRYSDEVFAAAELERAFVEGAKFALKGVFLEDGGNSNGK